MSAPDTTECASGPASRYPEQRLRERNRLVRSAKRLEFNAAERMQLISDWAACEANIEDLLNQPEPAFIGRIGGSDTNAVAALLNARAGNSQELWGYFQAQRDVVTRYNGFYDLRGDAGSYEAYVERLLMEYQHLADAFICNHQLLSLYMPDCISPDFFSLEFEGVHGFELLMSHLSAESPALRLYPYPYVERLTRGATNIMTVFSRCLSGKKVLVISPFSTSIEANFSNRKYFFRDYEYPEFSLSTLMAPITYAGLPDEFYPHANWLETTDHLIQTTSTQDFDIALLSCGSYALPIGNYVARVLGKKAFYIGGILQLMFGIMGRRYEHSFFTDQLDLTHFIYPHERELYLSHVNTEANMPSEAFGAYF